MAEDQSQGGLKPEAPSSLEALATRRFGKLTRAEKELLRQLPHHASHQAVGSRLDEQRSIRADLFRWLCTDEAARKHLYGFEIRTEEVELKGRLDLSYLQIPFPITCRKWSFPEGVSFIATSVPEVVLDGSTLGSFTGDAATAPLRADDSPILHADSLRTNGAVSLREGFRAEGEISFIGAEIGGDLTCSTAHLKRRKHVTRDRLAECALNLERSTVGGNVHLRRSCNILGRISLIGAKIEGSLDCNTGEFQDPDAIAALNAARAKVGGDIRLGAVFNGQVRLFGVEVGGDIDCTSGKFNNRGDIALNAESAKVDGAVFLGVTYAQIKAGWSVQRDGWGFKAQGGVRLFDASIGSNLVCHAGLFDNPGGVALDLERARVGGSLAPRYEFAAFGEVRLVGAEIGGDIECMLGRFNNPGRLALNAEGVKVAGAIFLGVTYDEIERGWIVQNKGWGFEAHGSIRLFGASIGSSLICYAGLFNNPGGVALDLERAKVGGSMLPSYGFAAFGEVRLFGTEIGGDLEAQQANFQNPGPASQTRRDVTALCLQRCQLGGMVDIGRDTVISGSVLIEDTRISRNLILNGTELDGVIGELRICRTQIGGSLIFESVRNAVRVDLTDTSCTVLEDDLASSVNQAGRMRSTWFRLGAMKLGSWPNAGANLVLDGFSYRRLSEPGSAAARVAWLRRQVSDDPTRRNGEFRPQPYRQLAEVLRLQGHERDAKLVLINMARDRRKWGGMSWHSRVGQRLLWATIANGYSPLRSLIWLIGLWIAGFILFGAAYQARLMVPSEKESYAAFVAAGTTPRSYEPFCAATYAVDLSLPIISFGQRDKWHPAAPFPPVGAATGEASGPIHDTLCTAGFTRGWFKPAPAPGSTYRAAVFEWIRWGYIALGWFFTTMLVAGVTGLVRRD